MGKSLYRKERVEKRKKFFSKKIAIKGPDVTSLFINKIVSILKKSTRETLLDIGTGNGFVLSKISRKLRKQSLRMWGLDISEEMVKIARKELKKYKNIKVIEGDNFSIPFKNEFFDVVTNKVTTNFSCREIHRVLKDGGYFVFKEYGRYKGLKEITELFKNRVIRRRKPIYYINKLREGGFKDIVLKEFKVKYKYKYEDLIDVIEMAPIIEKFSKKDRSVIKDKLFKNKESIWITSDPFIMVVRK